MRNLIFRALALVLILSSGRLWAHHPGDSSASPASAAVPTAHLLEPGQISLGWSWQLTQYPTLSRSELESEVRRLSAVLFIPEQAIQQTLELGIGATEWLQVSAALRAQRLERLREGHLHGNGSFGSHEMGSPAGWSNPELRVKARLARGAAWGLALHLGGSLPGGEGDALSDGISVEGTANTSTGKLKASPKFAYLGPALQPGSGAASFQAGLAWTGEWGLWEGSAAASGNWPAAYLGFKAGASATAGLALGRLFGEEGHERGWLGLEAAATQSEASDLDGRKGEDGGFSLTAGPRLRLPLGPRALGVLGVSVPLAAPAPRGPRPLAAFSLSLQALF